MTSGPLLTHFFFFFLNLIIIVLISFSFFYALLTVNLEMKKKKSTVFSWLFCTISCFHFGHLYWRGEQLAVLFYSRLLQCFSSHKSLHNELLGVTVNRERIFHFANVRQDNGCMYLLMIECLLMIFFFFCICLNVAASFGTETPLEWFTDTLIYSIEEASF